MEWDEEEKAQQKNGMNAVVAENSFDSLAGSPSLSICHDNIGDCVVSVVETPSSGTCAPSPTENNSSISEDMKVMK